MADVKITIFDNGPIEVTGPITVHDENGKALAFEEGDSVFFCRCGQSKDKPFCDGTHDKCGFTHKISG